MRDARDGSPVPGLQLVVYDELDVGLPRELARATSDATGRAEVAVLEPPLVLVATQRRPPFARNVRAVELVRGTTSELEIRLELGGSVRGRVVDEDHKPIPDADLLLGCEVLAGTFAPPHLIDATQVVARSAEDGTFGIDCIASAPEGVSLVAGELHARIWQPEYVCARKDGLGVMVEAELKGQQPTDLGDLVIPRGFHLAGQVVDASDVPVAGALVSLRSERQDARLFKYSGSAARFNVAPSQPGFVVLDGETLSDRSGRFVLGGTGEQVTVWTLAGHLQTFPLPALTPGERKEDLVLKLDDRTRVEIELVDAAGKRVSAELPIAADPNLFTSWRAGSPTKGLCGDFRFAKGAPLRDHVQCEPDGLWRFDLPPGRGELQGLELRLKGYECVRDELAGKPVAHLRYVLEELPSVRLKLHSNDSVAEKKGEKVYLEVQVCLATPEQRARARDPGYALLCCGRGSLLPVTWQGEDHPLVLLAAEKRPYWVYARLSDGGSGYTGIASMGPFEPGPVEHEIALSFADLCARSRSNTQKPAVEDTRSAGVLRARIVDAATREPIPAPSFAGEFLGAQDRPRSMPPGKAGADGALRAERVPAGEWKLSVSAAGHKSLVLEHVSVATGEEMDLGTLALEARALFRGQLELADGSAAPRGVMLSAIVTDTLAGRALTLEGGQFTIDADLPPIFGLLVHQRVLPDVWSSSSQLVRVENWDPGKETRVRLAPWRNVEVRVTGPAAEMPESQFALLVKLAPGEFLPNAERALPDDRHPLALPFEAPPMPGRRIFQLALVAGRYQFEGGGLLATIPATLFEVRDTDALQVVEILSR